jgi:CheY-like chemotaxis protein
LFSEQNSAAWATFQFTPALGVVWASVEQESLAGVGGAWADAISVERGGSAVKVHKPLGGVRVLVVEDDALLAMDLEAMLVEAGAVVVGLCQTVDEAMLRADAADFAVAVLDFGLGSEAVSPVARRLANRGVPFILYTGKSRHEPSLAEWGDRSIVQKPASPRVLVSAVRTALSR